MSRTGLLVLVAAMLGLGGQAVSTYRVSEGSGSLAPVGSPLALANHPESIALDRSGRFACVVDRDGVSIFRIDPADGSLTAAGAATAGTDPRASVIDSAGRYLYVANASSNTISTYRIDSDTGNLARVDADPGTTGIQDTPNGLLPLALAAHPSGRFLYVVNRNEGGSGRLDPLPGAPFAAGAGPTSIAFVTTGR